jgi:rhodanese-related sulfurtransferase
VRGSINIDASGALATYLGWLLPLGSPVTLLAASVDQLAAAQRELLRIGVDQIDAATVGDPLEWAAPTGLATYPLADFATLARVRAQRPVLVLDVRRASEWRAEHLPNALHLPLPDLPAAIPALPEGEIWVHCATGFRAAIAASLLARAGRDVVLIDDTFTRAPTTSSPSPG